ncbi:hypothetical protein FB45DRAFT_945880 [Roridomyces roridus]|uniref:RING-type domain-containing protein n=1 Tax=Roridomyces roridus TaxID=1738132 RepID=A0AAD7B3Q2_9AGAR|nr:hypothetical protein FB45DRAFT_945880 [Roridomyces roridus]
MPPHRSKAPVIDPRTFLDEVFQTVPPPPPPRSPPTEKHRRQSQVARKSTGGKPPRRPDESTPSRSSSPGSSRKKSQVARKSTGGKPPPNPKRKRPSEDGDDSDSSSSSNARKPCVPLPLRHPSTPISDSAAVPRLPLPVAQPAVVVPAHLTASCGLCPLPLGCATFAADQNQPIHCLKTSCHHDFHYFCYMRFLIRAPFNLRPCCPSCRSNILNEGQYSVLATTTAGHEGLTDMTDDVEKLFDTIRIAKQQILMDMLAGRQFHIVEHELLTGPGKIDVNYRSPEGGFTPLHLSALKNDVQAIDLLLRLGADKHIKSDKNWAAIDFARMNSAFDAVKRLEEED